MAEHGTRANYLRGCRCNECVEVNREYMSKYRAANREKMNAQARERYEANLDEVRKRKREDARKRRAANPEWHREYKRKYYAANIEVERERGRKNGNRYYAANSDKVIENSRKWYAANRERAWETNRRWREANPDKVWEMDQRRNHSRRARQRDAFVERVDPLTVFDRDGWTCHICGEPIDPTLKAPDPLSVSIDHVIPLAVGGEHSYANCSTAHFRCNVLKGAKIA